MHFNYANTPDCTQCTIGQTDLVLKYGLLNQILVFVSLTLIDW